MSAVSEFAAQFEQACHDRRLRLFVLPPRSPQRNSRVERAQRTRTEVFYEVTSCLFLIAQLHRELLHWERTYNTVRLHRALDYLTPSSSCCGPTTNKSAANLLDEYTELYFAGPSATIVHER